MARAVRAIAGLLVAVGLLVVAIAWFGLADPQPWPLALLTVVGVAVLPYWWVAFGPYLAAGIRLGLLDVPPFMWVPVILMPVRSIGLDRLSECLAHVPGWIIDPWRLPTREYCPKTEGSPMSRSLDEWIEGYRLAWENRDAAAAAGLFTSDATYRSNIFEDAYEGRDGVDAYWRSVTSSQSDVTVRMGRPFIDGSRVAVEFWTNMKVDEEDTTLPGCLLLDFDDDGLCRRLREYWHFASGRAEPPAGWGE